MGNIVQVNRFCKHNIVGVINLTEIDAKEKTYNTDVTELKWNTSHARTVFTIIRQTLFLLISIQYSFIQCSQLIQNGRLFFFTVHSLFNRSGEKHLSALFHLQHLFWLAFILHKNHCLFERCRLLYVLLPEESVLKNWRIFGSRF